MMSKKSLIAYNLFRERTRFNPVTFIINYNINSYEKFCDELEKKLVMPPSNEYYTNVINYINEQEKKTLEKQKILLDNSQKNSPIMQTEETKVEETKVEETKVEETKVEETKVEEPKAPVKKKRKKAKEK